MSTDTERRDHYHHLTSPYVAINIIFKKLLKSNLTYFNLKTGDCSFYFGLTNCQWNNVDLVDNFNWTVHSGRTGSIATGPSYDRRGSTTGIQL